jgi:predicted TIM-barrel fold metal-dependent hydrolase
MEGLRITDVHVHIQPLEMVRPEALEILKLGKKDFEFIVELRRNPSKFVELLDREGVWRACLINYVAKEVLGFTEDVNAFVSGYAREYPDRLLPFGGVDPRAPGVADRMEDLISKYEVRGVKIHPPHQLLYPNSYRTEGLKGLETVYTMAEDNGLPVMIHTGTSIFPKAIVRFGDPLTLDDVAVDFPKLKIIMAHGGRPFWTQEAFFLLRRHRNLFLDVSSIPPKRLLHYFPRLEEVAHKTLFGSDWPGPMVPGIRQNLEDFHHLPISDEAKRSILEKNALSLFR